MKRNRTSLQHTLLRCSAAVGLVACGASTPERSLAGTESALAGVEAAQEGLGELKAQADACLDTFAVCVADGGEDCREALRECAPKPPKLEKLKEAVDACKAGEAPPPMSPPELAGEDVPDGDSAAADDSEAAEKPGAGKPPMGPPGDSGAKDACKAVMKAAQKAHAKCDHHHDVVELCVGDLETCVLDGAAPSECAAGARDCFKAAAEAAFAKRCEEGLTKCESEDAPAEKCAAVAAKCAEGPVAPAAAE